MPECPVAGLGPPTCGIAGPLADAIDYMWRLVHGVFSAYQPAATSGPAPGEPAVGDSRLIAVFALLVAGTALCLHLRHRRSTAGRPGTVPDSGLARGGAHDHH